MKKKRFTILYTLLIFAIIGITAFSIYAGSADDNKLKKEKCAECHSDSIQFKEWENSAHAKAIETLLKEPRSNAKCMQCHSSDYKLYDHKNPWGITTSMLTPKEAQNAVSCSSCHRHDSGLKHNLIMPVEKLCVSCHKFDCG